MSGEGVSRVEGVKRRAVGKVVTLKREHRSV